MRYLPVRRCALVVATGACMLSLTASAGGAKPAWQSLPVVPAMTGKTKAQFVLDVRRSIRRSMRPGVFAKVGDSNTELPNDLYGLGCARVRLDGRRNLKPVLSRYRKVPLSNPRMMPNCTPSNSFSRRSSAAQFGTYMSWSLDRISNLPETGVWTRPPGCRSNETPLSCEVRHIRPRYAFIMSGTNDVGLDLGLGVEPASQAYPVMTRLIRTVRKLGSVPVVSTLPPLITRPSDQAAVEKTNREIARAARDSHAPLINLWRALSRPEMINSGLFPDGLHLSSRLRGKGTLAAPTARTYADSVDFRPGPLRYGANMRNLIWLKTLGKIDDVTDRYCLRNWPPG